MPPRVRPTRSRTVLTPGVAISTALLIVVGAIGIVLFTSARSQDRQQLVNEQQIVHSATQDAMAKLGDALRPNVYWDDGYNHMVGKIDAGWADKNLGPYARDTSGVAVLLLMGQNGSPAYAYLGSEPDKNVDDFAQDDAVGALVRGALAKTTAPPVTETGFVRVGDRIYLAAASQVVPNDDRAKAPLPKHVVEIYLQVFGADHIAKVEKSFGVAKVSLTVQAPPKGMAAVSLFDAAHAPIGYLWWRPASPGTNFALTVVPFALAVLAISGVLLWLALRSWWTTESELSRQRLESELLRQESSAKSAFIGTISHELRTPLNAILGFSGLISQKLFGPVGVPQYEEYVEHIHASGCSLLNTINDVIEISRIEGDDRMFERQSVDLYRSVRDALAHCRNRAAAKGIELTCDGTNPHIMANSNAAAIHDILCRLLDNAVKFSPEGQAVQVSLQQLGVTARIRICDSGIGIDAAQLERIGRPFVQSENHLRRNFGGLGLGLAICNGTVRALGGTMEIESVVGAGTTVTVGLPRAAALRHAEVA